MLDFPLMLKGFSARAFISQYLLYHVDLKKNN